MADVGVLLGFWAWGLFGLSVLVWWGVFCLYFGGFLLFDCLFFRFN